MDSRFARWRDQLDQRQYRNCLEALPEMLRSASTPDELLVAARTAAIATLHGLEYRLVRRAMRMEGSPPEARVHMAMLLYGQGEFLELDGFLTKFLAEPVLSPQCQMEAMAIRAASFAARRRFRTARTWLERARELLPAVEPARQHRFRYMEWLVAYMDNRWEEVEAGAAAHLAAHPAEVRFYSLRAVCLEHLGRPADALRTLEEATVQVPDHPHLWYALAGLAWTLGHRQQALDALDRFAALGRGARVRTSVRHLRELWNRQSIRLPVLPVRQGHNHCFPTCLAMVMGWFDHPEDYRAVGAAVMDGTRGTPLFRALEYLQSRGWVSRTFRATPERLRMLIDRGAPPILGLEYAGGAHVHVCVGYDEEHFAIQDPSSTHMRWLRLRHFDQVYAHSDFWALAFVPAGQEAILDGLPAEDDHRIRQMQRCWEALHEQQVETACQIFAELEATEEPGRLHFFRLRTWPRVGEREKALEAANALLERYSDHDQIITEVAEHLGRLDEQERAVTLLRERVGHLSRTAYTVLGRCASNPAEAAGCFRKAAQADPQSAEAMLLWGQAELQQDRYDAAEACFEAALEMEDTPGAAADLANLHLHQGRSQEAVAAFRAVLKRERRYPWAWWRRGEAHRHLGQYRKALRCYRVAHVQEPDQAHVVRSMASAWEALNQPLRARQVLQESPLLADSDDLQTSLAGLCLNQQWWEEALAISRAGLERWPDDARFAPIAAEALRHLNGGEEGRRILTAACEAKPENPYLAARLGRYLLLEGCEADGVAAFQKALELAPGDADYIDWLISAASRQPKPGPALAFLEELADERDDLLWEVARLWRRHDPKRALRYGESALEEQGRTPAGLTELGWLALQADRLEQAESVLRMALDLQPGLARACHGLSRVFGRQEKHHESMHWLREAIFAAGDRSEAERYTDELGDLYEKHKDLTAIAVLLADVEGRVPEAWRLTYIGYVCEQQEKYGEALALYEKAIALQPELIWPHYRMPQALVSAGRQEEALAEATRTAERWAGQVGCVWVLGRCHEALGQVQEALEAFRRALAIQPDWQPVRQSLYKLVGREPWPALAEQVAHLAPAEQAGALAYFGDAYRQDGQTTRAVTAYEAAVDRNPAESDAWIALAEMALQANQHALAWERIIPFLALAPGEAVSFARWLAGRTELHLAAPAVSRAAGQLAGGEPAVQAEVLALLAEIHAQMGRPEKAREVWLQVLEHAPEHLEALVHVTTDEVWRRKFQAVAGRLDGLMDRQAVGPEVPHLLANYLTAALALGRPRRPHWRRQVVERLRHAARSGERGTEWEQLHAIYEQLEIEFGNVRGAVYGRVVKDGLLNWLRVRVLRLGALLRRPPLDVRSGESTAPVTTGAIYPETGYRAFRGPAFYRKLVEGMDRVGAAVRGNPVLFSLTTLICLIGFARAEDPAQVGLALFFLLVAGLCALTPFLWGVEETEI